MQKIRSAPAFVAKNAEICSKRMKRLLADTDFRSKINASFPSSRKTLKPRSSRFKGVSLCKATGKWIAHLKGKYLGTFFDEEIAAATYDKAASTEWGDRARLNFPLELMGKIKVEEVQL